MSSFAAPDKNADKPPEPLPELAKADLKLKVGEELTYTLVDPATVLDEQDKWMREWDKLFIQK